MKHKHTVNILSNITQYILNLFNQNRLIDKEVNWNMQPSIAGCTFNHWVGEIAQCVNLSTHVGMGCVCVGILGILQCTLSAGTSVRLHWAVLTSAGTGYGPTQNLPQHSEHSTPSLLLLSFLRTSSGATNRQRQSQQTLPSWQNFRCFVSTVKFLVI